MEVNGEFKPLSSILYKLEGNRVAFRIHVKGKDPEEVYCALQPEGRVRLATRFEFRISEEGRILFRKALSAMKNPWGLVWREFFVDGNGALEEGCYLINDDVQVVTDEDLPDEKESPSDEDFWFE